MNTIKKEHIKKIIDDWDPIELLPFAPPNEYDPETEKIYNLIKDIEDIEFNYLVAVIFNVFKNAFGEDVFMKTIDDCRIVANNIFLYNKSLS